MEDFDNEYEYADDIEEDAREADMIDENTHTVGFEVDAEYGRFRRPEPKDYRDRNIDMMVLDVDYYTSAIKAKPQVSKLPDSPVRTVLRMYGVDRCGNTFLAHVYDFLSYFYVQAPNDFDYNNQDSLEGLRKKLNDRVPDDLLQRYEGANLIQNIEACPHLDTLLNYEPSRLKKSIVYLKIYVLLPSLVGELRKQFEQGISIGGLKFSEQTWEANMAFALRFMIDKGISGMSWVTLPKGTFEIIPLNRTVSTCQTEIAINHNDIVARLCDDPQWSDIAPLRVLSFDIECAAKKGFPTPEKDPVITIAAIGKYHNQKKEDLRIIFQLNTCSKVSGAILRDFESEVDLLVEFDKFMKAYDADIITGYNIINFDLPYIHKRTALLLKRLGNPYLNQFPFWGRLKTTKTIIKKGKYLAKSMGMRDMEDINTEGRIQLDIMIEMMKEHKLSSYSLNSVSFQYLNEQKEDVHHSIIKTLQDKGPDERKRIASYCLKDALLPLRLLETLKIIYNFVEMARVTGVTPNILFKRGQQIKVLSQLYRKANPKNIIVPVSRHHMSSGDEKGYVGADVLSPKTGFYSNPIATLDFASLYPSIMIAHNLCFTTMIPASEVANMDIEDYTITPTLPKYYFVKPSLKEGLLPTILQDLLGARKKAKKLLGEAKQALKNATTESEKEEAENLIGVYDGRQLALKISANSVYGFTGARRGSLPCIEIASSVTAFGRDMINATKKYVMENFSVEKGFKYNADVIYGDTDSVMVNFGPISVAEAMKLGEKGAAFVSSFFKNPIKLEFEKVYYPYLLLSKKRYAGKLWTNPNAYDKRDIKGLEIVRRDNCLLVRQCLGKVIDLLLNENDTKEQAQNKATSYVRSVIFDLLNNRFDMSYLVITKGLTRDLDADPEKGGYKTKMAHVELAYKLRQRDPLNCPGIGDRIPYVIVAGPKNAKTYECSEDPVYVMDNDLPIDKQYYIEKQLRKPLERIFEAMNVDCRELFEGKHTLQVAHTKISLKSGLGAFVTKNQKCLNCHSIIPNGKSLCNACRPFTLEHYLTRLLTTNVLKEEYHNLWTECQRCQGTLHQDIICSNNDCQIFYRRIKVQKDLKDSLEKQSLFDF